MQHVERRRLTVQVDEDQAERAVLNDDQARLEAQCGVFAGAEVAA